MSETPGNRPCRWIIHLIIFLTFFLLSFLLCSCIHHGSEKMIMPSAVPEKVIVKTAIADDTLLPDVGSASADPWSRCALEINSGQSLRKVADLDPAEFKRRVQITFMIQEADTETSFVIERCMNGKVYACLVSERTNCVEPLDLSTEPNDTMKDICSNPELDNGILTPRVTGVNSAFEWVCHDGAPVITRRIAEPDPAGYDKALWFEIPKPE